MFHELETPPIKLIVGALHLSGVLLVELYLNKNLSRVLWVGVANQTSSNNTNLQDQSDMVEPKGEQIVCSPPRGAAPHVRGATRG